MMISTKGRYALRVMIDLAQHDRSKYIPLKEIAARQDISEKYLEIIIKSLSKEHFVEGLRGKGGGYRLTHAPEDYSVASILKIGSLTVDFNLSLTKLLKTLIISMLLSFFIVKFTKLYVGICRII